MLAAVVATHGCSQGAPVVELAITHAPGLAIEELQIRVGEQIAISELRSDVQLALPEDAAGTPTTIQIWGLAARAPIAYGALEVTPRGDQTVHGAIHLDTLTCSSSCSPGTTRCEPGGRATCEPRADGCFAWSTPSPCPDATPFCLGDRCESSCDAAVCAAIPDPVCADPLTLRTFTGPGACAPSGCVHPSTDATCPGGCATGACQPPRYQQIDLGIAHGCGLTVDGRIVCWGANDNGETEPPAGTFTRIALGFGHGCALRSDQTVACWGLNADGQATPPTGTFSAIDAGGQHTCAIRTNGEVRCWGSTEHGQSTPPAGAFARVSAGMLHTCGITTTDAIRCWGSNNGGQLDVPAGTFAFVDADALSTCAIRSTGTVSCWGSNIDDQPTLRGPATSPTGTFQQVAVGFDFPCGVLASGTLRCWDTENTAQLPPDTAGSDFVEVRTSQRFGCARRTGGTVMCWGLDDVGQSSPP